MPDQIARALRRGLAANSTATGFTAKAPVLIKPSNDGVIDLTLEGATVPELLKLWAVGVGASNDGFSVRLIGWQSVLHATDAAKRLWIPQTIAELACLLGTLTGTGAGVVPSTEKFVDTMTIVKEGVTTALTTNDGNIVRYNPADDTMAFAIIPLQGFELIEFDFDQTTNTPTMNVLYGLL